VCFSRLVWEARPRRGLAEAQVMKMDRERAECPECGEAARKRFCTIVTVLPGD